MTTTTPSPSRKTRRSPHGERGLKSALLSVTYPALLSLSSWRAWIEIESVTLPDTLTTCRSPHGERGLKYSRLRRPAHAAARRSPHGERGLKFVHEMQHRFVPSRSPHGERGLKSRRPYAGLWCRCRSPHGERGLKWTRRAVPSLQSPVALLMESVD